MVQREATHPAAGRIAVTAAVFMATFLVSLDASIVATAMPAVVAQIGGLDTYAWVFSAYLLACTVTIPIYGRLSDTYGRKPLFLLAVALFLVGSALCGQARSMQELIAFRVVQGVGAGGVFPITQTVLGDLFDLEERARLLGLVSTIWGVSALIGPAVGGLLTQYASWRWVFYVNPPFCVITLFLIWRFLHEKLERRKHQMDYVGALALSASVVCLLFGLQEATPGPGNDAHLAVVLFAISVLALAAFIWHERRFPEPLVPLHLFARREIGVCALGALIVSVALYSQSAFIPPYLQGVQGIPPTAAGLILASASVAWPVASGLAGKLLLQIGYRPLAVAGGVFLSLGYAALAFVLQPDSPVIVPIVALAIVGSGFGCFIPMALLAMQNAVGWEQRGVVTGANQFARNIGGALGVAIAGVAFTTSLALLTHPGVDPTLLLTPETRAQLTSAQVVDLGHSVSAALKHAYTLLLGFCVLGLAVAWFFPSGRPRSRADAQSAAVQEMEAASVGAGMGH